MCVFVCVCVYATLRVQAILNLYPKLRGFSEYTWRRRWHPTPVLLPGKSHGGRSLVGCSPWGPRRVRQRLSDFTFTFHFDALETEMATHSSLLAWRIPGTGEPGGLPSMRSHRVQHRWSDLAAAAAGEIYDSLQLIRVFQKLGLSEHSYKLTVLFGKCLISSFPKNMISSSQAFILSDLLGNQTYIPLNSNIQKFIYNFEKSETLFCYPGR